MTEVDVSIAENTNLGAGVRNTTGNITNAPNIVDAEQSPSNAMSNSSRVNATLSHQNGQQSNDNFILDACGNVERDADIVMDTEYDSQITSSSADSNDGDRRNPKNINDNEKSTNSENKNVKSIRELNGSSSSVSTNISNISKKQITGENSSNDMHSSSVPNKGSNNNNVDCTQIKVQKSQYNETVTSQDSSIHSKYLNHVDDSNDSGESCESRSTSEYPDSNDFKNVIPIQDPLSVPQKENGNDPQIVKKIQTNMNIVNLADDSDGSETEMADTANPKLNVIAKTKQSSGFEGTVIIGSDSDTETFVPPKIITNRLNVNNINSHVDDDDDDDDDCVVIEDDSPIDITKRKNIHVDRSNNLEELQSPNKRLRSNAPIPVAQLLIRDSRSIIPQGSSNSLLKRNTDSNVYPVNITPASTNISISGPPKLVPVGSPMSVPTLPIPSLSSLAPSTNLLPGLTDDMFVLEAPSFIVPYIYEKPPLETISCVLKNLETKFAFTKDDLTEVDKTDEFDMMTEQNKESRDEKNNSKKKKRRRGDDGDDSWTEESADDDYDDDDDSESGMRTKVLIKEASDDITALKGAIKSASVLAQSVNSTITNSNKLDQENYFESPLGKFFMNIGVGLVQEYVQSDLIRLQKRKMRKSLGRNVMEFERAITALTSNLEASKKKNAPFKFNMKRCEFCNFKSESALAMANHYETPHMNGAIYKCNFCIFEIRNATEIIYHMEAIHNIKARLIKPLPYHQCANCGFEDNGKAKLARHLPVCAKKFRPEFNLSPPTDWEAPAKIPRIKPRHGLVGTATAYQAMAAQAAAQKAALASIQQQQQARTMQAAALAAQNAANKLRGRPPQTMVSVKTAGPASVSMIRNTGPVRNTPSTNVVITANYQMPAGNSMIQTTVKKTPTGQPSISITPLPRQNAANAASMNIGNTMATSSKIPTISLKVSQGSGNTANVASITASGNKTQFVICEICDGYIKDLEQLRNHMQWMHKVKIHPKMIYNRPPLNCQKCQFRFFTDQGLERHLLGSHGLVTSSMQEAANKGKDAGRCPVCGKMYQWKLLNHVSRDHHMTLKPAHLSYKCTVCTATFGMYKQFETHVYTAHSTVAKKAMDNKKNMMSSHNVAGGAVTTNNATNSQRHSFSSANESLLKPLKINDEITIIPQPTSRARLTNFDTHVID